MEVKRRKMEWHEKMFAQQEIALEQHRKQLEIEEMQLEVQKRQVEVEERHNEMKIMETDTTGMDSISVTYWNNLKIKIMKKRGFIF